MSFRNWTLSRRITLFSVAFLVLALLQSFIIFAGVLSVSQLVRTIYEQRFQSSRTILEDTVRVTRTNLGIVQLVQQVTDSTDYGPRFEDTRMKLLGEVRALPGQIQAIRPLLAGEPGAAEKLLSIGAHPVPAGLDPIELAAWTTAARAVLNMQETYTRN